jgi:PAS domain S-box-containing protein
MGRSHLFLSHDILHHLEQEALEILQPRLSALLGHMALGFSATTGRTSVVLHDLAEEGRRAERRIYTTILDMVDALVAVVDADGHFVGFNGACERVSGYSFDEVYGKHHTFVLVPEDHEKSRALFSRFKENPSQQRVFVPHRSEWLTRDGKRRQIEWSTTAVLDDDGALRYVIGTGTDVTERRKMEDELVQARRQVAKAQEHTRIRLAQDLHDGVVQQLLGLSYQLAEMQRRASERGSWTPEQQLEELIPALEMTRNDVIAVAHDLRRLISSLRPPALRELGLAQIMEAYVDDWRQRVGSDGPQVTLHLASLEGKHLPEPVAICIFRVVQEALWNAYKHADAAHVTVGVDCHDDEIMLHIRDDGVGFRIPSHLFHFAGSGRFGFIGMQERVQAVDGLLSVWSKPGRGTEVQAHIPLRNQEGQYERSNTGVAGG